MKALRQNDWFITRRIQVTCLYRVIYDHIDMIKNTAQKKEMRLIHHKPLYGFITNRCMDSSQTAVWIYHKPLWGFITNRCMDLEMSSNSTKWKFSAKIKWFFRNTKYIYATETVDEKYNVDEGDKRKIFSSIFWVKFFTLFNENIA